MSKGLRGLLQILLVCTLTGAGISFTAPEASAATVNVTVECSGFTTLTITASPGDTVILTPQPGTSSPGCFHPTTGTLLRYGPAANYNTMPTYFSSYPDGGASDPYRNTSPPWTFVIKPTAPLGLLSASAGFAPSSFYVCNNCGSGRFIDFNIVAASTPSGDSPSSFSSPADVIQQVGAVGTQDCTTVEDSHLAWGTGLSGGWAKQWGEWLNNRAGGWVCSRMMRYDTSHQRWVLTAN